MEKTNAMRILDARGVPYLARCYDPALTDGLQVADALGLPRERTFKTLVTAGADGGHYVFVLPVCCSLDLKKAARAVGIKSVAMLPQRQLFPLTGYVHGGCSPIGMKRAFPTVLDEAALLFDTVCMSAGKRGLQLELSAEALAALLGAVFDDVTE